MRSGSKRAWTEGARIVGGSRGMVSRKILKFKASEIAENASNFVNH